MNIMNKVTWKCMKQNKKRTVVTILGVIICVAMISGVCTLAFSLQHAMVDANIKLSGDYEVNFMNVDDSVYQTLRQHEYVGQAGRLGQYASAKEATRDETIRYLSIMKIDESDRDLAGIQLKEGSYPRNKDEILIEESLAQSDPQRYRVGAVIELDLGLEKLNEQGQQEGFSFKKKQSYTITGIGGSEYISMLNRNSVAYIPFTGNDRTIAKEQLSVYIKMNNHHDFYDKLEELEQLTGTDDVNINQTLLASYGVSSSPIIEAILLSVFVTCLIIMAGGISLIYNAFSISLSERSRYLGMLSSVGATQKQKRASIIFEAAIIGCIAIPIGLLCGILGISCTFLCLNSTIEKLYGIRLYAVSNGYAIAGTILFSILILMISAWMPSIKASKISAIHAIRQHEDFKIKRKHVKTNSLVGRIFGFEAELGLKNIKRNRHRYRATLTSLTACVILFLSAYASTASMFSSTNTILDNADIDLIANIMMTDGNTEDPLSVIDDSLMLQLQQLPYADRSIVVWPGMGDVEQNGIFSRTFLERKAELRKESCPDCTGIQDGIELVDIYVLRQSDFDAYMKKNGKAIPDDNSKPWAVAVNQMTIKLHDRYEKLTITDLKQGDQIPIKTSSQTQDQKDETLDITIMELMEHSLEELPVNQTQPKLQLITTLDNMKLWSKSLKAMGQNNVLFGGRIYYQSTQSERLEDEINKVFAQHDKIQIFSDNIAATNTKNKQMTLLISVFLYGFVCLIMLICMMNIINTISTGVQLRKREFAMIKSIGITRRKFYRMICFESLFYGIKALLYGLPISFVIMYGLYRTTSDQFYTPFQIPWRMVILTVVGIFLILSLTMMYAIRRIRKDNIVETIRNESI